MNGLFFKVSACFFVLNRSRNQSSNQMVEHAAAAGSNTSQFTTRTQPRTQARTQTQTQTHTRTRKAGRQSRRRVERYVHRWRMKTNGRGNLYFVPPSRTGRLVIGREQEQGNTEYRISHFCGNSNSNSNSNGHIGLIGGEQQTA